MLREWGAHDVLTLTINRPDRRNALDPELLTALADALRDDGERASAVILRGAGTEAFSSGYDLARLTGTADDLRLSVPAVSLGVVYRFQFVARLVQICGIARASDLLLAMPELDAEHAAAWGLVTEVSPGSEIDNRVHALAEMLAASPRTAVRGTKASLDLLARRAISGDDLVLAQQLRAEAAASPQRLEAVTRRKQSISRRSRTDKG